MIFWLIKCVWGGGKKHLWKQLVFISPKKESLMEELTFIFEMLIKTDFTQKFFCDLFFFSLLKNILQVQRCWVWRAKQSSGEKCHVCQMSNSFHFLGTKSENISKILENIVKREVYNVQKSLFDKYLSIRGHKFKNFKKKEKKSRYLSLFLKIVWECTFRLNLKII